MRAAQLVELRRFEIQDYPDRNPGPGEVLIESQAVGLCASDVHYFAEGGIGRNRVRFPQVLGHEPMGVVKAVGPGVSEDWIGKRVAIEPGIPCYECEFCLRGDVNLCPNVVFFATPPVDGAYRQWFTHPVKLVEELPEGFSADNGAMMEPLGVAVHAVDLIRPKTALPTTVLGCGTIGLCLISVLRAAGVCPILAVDPLKYRTDLALKMGADQVITSKAADAVEPLMDLTNGRGTDYAFEATGDHESHAPLMEMAAIGGQVVIVGITSKDFIGFGEGTARSKGLTIRLCRRSRATLKRSIDLISHGRADMTPLVTHHYPLSQIQEAFEVAESYRDGIVKAVIHPNET